MTGSDQCLLIIEDDPGLQRQLKWQFDDLNKEILIAGNVAEALDAIRRHDPAVIIQDLGLPPDPEGVTEGFRCIDEILTISPMIKIIVLTGKTEHRNALKAIGMGAYDFYHKPFDPDDLKHAIAHAYKISSLEFENQHQPVEPLPGIITAHPKMISICRMVKKIGKSNITTTILGESGTGKEVIARAIHSESQESQARFVAINCAAVPENLIESELFGYEKGAFTGAVKTTPGKIETANGGTLFLDEIGDMPLPAQAKLLRFLQQRTIERVGGRTEIPVDLRIVCATNKHIEDMVAQGNFREDLYYRIAEIIIDLPPVSERASDSILIATQFLKKYCSDSGIPRMTFSPDALRAIEQYKWPGNIREIENKIKSATVMAESNLITAEDLGLETQSVKPATVSLKKARSDAERQAIETAMQMSEQNVSAAAKLLGVTRPTLYDMLKKHSFRYE